MSLPIKNKLSVTTMSQKDRSSEQQIIIKSLTKEVIKPEDLKHNLSKKH